MFRTEIVSKKVKTNFMKMFCAKCEKMKTHHFAKNIKWVGGVTK
jgi:hypothetical protein